MGAVDSGDMSMRAVLVGCGAQSEVWIQAIRNVPEVRLVGFVDLNLEAARARGSPAAVDLPAMLRTVRPDAVFDCTVPSAHRSVTLEALRHGCHVLGEKPMAETMEDARDMVAAARESGKTYAVTQNFRYDPNLRRLRSFLPRLGRLTELHSDFFVGAHFGGFRERMRHPLLLDMAVHTFDAARLLSGADPAAVTCREWNPAGSWYADGGSAAAIFEMSGGVVYTYRGSWCSEGLRTPWASRWRVVGERGSVLWNGSEEFHSELVARTGDFFSQVESVPVEGTAGGPGGHEALIREFARCVETGGIPETECGDNIRSLAMVHGAIESARTGKRVEL
jgi:predicted dehydrogenase